MEKIIVVDFGGQYNQLIARRVRDLGVYCEIVPYTIDMAKLAAMQPAGLIFTGGPNSVYLETSPHISDEIFGLNVPILGICYGCQILAYMLGGTVSPAGGNFEEPVTQATLKVVGAFHGLSRERSDARKYPAIHPIDSWSKYQGVVDRERVEQARAILKRSNEINQMMKVIGEEGTSDADYTVYQKGELLDAVYLQQNSFDPIDAACGPDRQRYEFDVLYDVLKRDFRLDDKKEIRAFFNQLRQEFLDWHNTEFRTPEFEAQEKRLKDFYLSKAAL